jgi:hypothetical protein
MNVYTGLFLVCFAGLALEVTLVRLLSVTTWYYLAFFAISTALLGMTAGATKVYLHPKSFNQENIAISISRSCIFFAISIPLTLITLCLIPLDIEHKNIMFLFSLFITTLACALPFYFAGIVISAVLTKYNLPIGRLYASDLIGASLGCLFVLGGMELFDAPSLILLCSCPAAIAAFCFAWKEPSIWFRRVGLLLSLFFLLAGVLNSLSPKGIRPLVVKGSRIEPTNNYFLERWNSFSRIAIYKGGYSEPQYWGPSPHAPKDPVEQHWMNIDGDAATILTKFNSLKDIDYLRYDVTNIAYYLDRKGQACVIGVGGGRDIQSAILFGAQHVTGIELNPIFINLLQNEFREFAGIADRPDVTLVTAEARSYLAHNPEKYETIQMSLIDTWAATGAGAFSLSENSLYTVEAWKLFVSRLEDNGIFTVSRWHSSKDIGETGRVLSLAVSTLIQLGIKNPSEHLAMVSAKKISTLLVSRQPFAQEDLNKLVKITDDLGFKIVCVPGEPPADYILRNIVLSKTADELSTATAGSTLNYDPPTDENPYFFNMLRLSNLRAFSKDNGVLKGNLTATLTLLGLLLTLSFVAIAAIVLPLLFRKRNGLDNERASKILWSGALYFILIGCGFMLTEIAMIQRLTVLLSHPLYALGILLFTLIASTGIGSLLSDRLPLTKKPWLYLYPILTAVCLIGLSFLLNIILAKMMTTTIMSKIVVSISVIFPMGLLMGLFFPTGMRLVNYVSSSDTPWYWALNGIFGVLCSALAVLISIYVGISTNFYIAAACYAFVLIAQIGLRRSKAKAD